MKSGVSFNQANLEDIYDWNGEQLKPEIRQYLSVNHIVRIQVNYPKQLGEAIYVKIIDVIENDFIGIVQDTYRSFFEGEIIYVENGETIRFPRNCVIEVPLSWNPELKAVAQTTGLARSITGMLPIVD